MASPDQSFGQSTVNGNVNHDESDQVSSQKMLELLKSVQEKQIQLEQRLKELEMNPSPATKDNETKDEQLDMSELIGAIDQGTTSSRFLIFNRAGEPVASHQIEFKQIYPNPGYFMNELYCV